MSDYTAEIYGGAPDECSIHWPQKPHECPCAQERRDTAQHLQQIAYEVQSEAVNFFIHAREFAADEEDLDFYTTAAKEAQRAAAEWYKDARAMYRSTME